MEIKIEFIGKFWSIFCCLHHYETFAKISWAWKYSKNCQWQPFRKWWQSQFFWLFMFHDTFFATFREDRLSQKVKTALRFSRWKYDVLCENFHYLTTSFQTWLNLQRNPIKNVYFETQWCADNSYSVTEQNIICKQSNFPDTKQSV